VAAFAALLRAGDPDALATRAAGLLARKDEAATHALSLLADPARLGPLAETLLAGSVLTTPYLEALLRRAGLAAARALWASRIRRPATPARRLAFVSWLALIGRPADELLRGALTETAGREPSPSQSACAEDLLLALPRALELPLRAAVERMLESPSPRVRQLAASALARALEDPA
jgi:hypothetical protein